MLIITQSYTASLTSMLTIESLQPEFIDIKEIKRNNYFVGYQNQSFVKTILINELGFNESQLKAYNTPEEYHEALSKGTNNGGVAAIFDESPYINVFLSKSLFPLLFDPYPFIWWCLICPHSSTSLLFPRVKVLFCFL